MVKFKSLFLYYHTLRYLRFSQMCGQVACRFRREIAVVEDTPDTRVASKAWVRGAPKHAGMIGPSSFRFLNCKRTLDGKEDWNDPNVDKLWLYNLHYFEFLNSSDKSHSKEWKQKIIRRWIVDNPPCQGNGWEPYPVSLRIYNWIRWLWEGNRPVEGMLESLAQQSRYLTRRVETHILANHYLINGKALVFSGLFFEGREAAEWLRKGLRILRREYREQILSDGAHYERSPMYHSLLTEDTLDLCNLLSMFPLEQVTEVGETCRKSAVKMLQWLQVMTFSDSRIPLFNDSALGIAASPKSLLDYATRLGISSEPVESEGSRLLRVSGFARLESSSATLFASVGTMMPDYQPGHSHADALSFELAIDRRKVIVDTGVGTYTVGAARDWQRSTMAHNTVAVNNQSSSEVWASFRVARRARVEILNWQSGDPQTTLTASHDGYRRISGVGRHIRTWKMDQNRLIFEDKVEGVVPATLDWRLHIAPELKIIQMAEYQWCLCDDNESMVAIVTGSPSLQYFVENALVWPEFGRSVSTSVLRGRIDQKLPLKMKHEINWDTRALANVR